MAMEFTHYIWRLYADSERGREAIAKTAESFLDVDSIDDMMWQWPLHKLDSEGEPIQIEGEFVEADLRVAVRGWLCEEKVDSDEAARSLFTKLVDAGIEMSQEKDGERRFYYFAGEGWEDQVFSNIAAISLALHEAFPEHFLPYLFKWRFNQVTAICDAFTVPIPKPPGKMQKRDRALYYIALNQA